VQIHMFCKPAMASNLADGPPLTAAHPPPRIPSNRMLRPVTDTCDPIADDRDQWSAIAQLSA